MASPVFTRWRAKGTSLWKSLGYEWDYFLRKFKPLRAFLFLVLLLGAVITGLSDTESFFTTVQDYLPKEWSFFRNKEKVLTLSAFILTVLFFAAWLKELSQASEEINDLSNIAESYLIPAQEVALKRLRTSIKKKFDLSDSIRLSIFIPEREGCFCWRLKIVCRTENIRASELKVSLKLYEGVLGYAFLKSKEHCIEFVDISNTSGLPNAYIHLDERNYILINRNLKGVLVTAAFQEGSIAGLLAIDTEDVADFVKMQEYKLHSHALDWIIAKSDVIRLLWRVKNNV